jgi:hypothetical protein
MTNRIEVETCLLPELIANCITSRRQINESSRLALEVWLVSRAERIYANNKRWARKIRGAYGRDWLYAFMEHWTDSWLLRHPR